MQTEQYQLLPALAQDEYESLKADIARRGVMVPPLIAHVPLPAAYPLRPPIAIDDPLLTLALRYIRQHAGTGLAIEQMVSDLATSRRLLERRFRQKLGRGIWDELQRVRLDRARSMLACSPAPIAQVATECGFSSPRHLSVAFRKAMAMTPRQYRQSRVG